VDGWVVGQTDRQVDRWLQGQIEGCVAGQPGDTREDGQTAGRLQRGTRGAGGQTDAGGGGCPGPDPGRGGGGFLPTPPL